jgi:hypothetical protein
MPMWRGSEELPRSKISHKRTILDIGKIWVYIVRNQGIAYNCIETIAEFIIASAVWYPL